MAHTFAKVRWTTFTQGNLPFVAMRNDARTSTSEENVASQEMSPDAVQGFGFQDDNSGRLLAYCGASTASSASLEDEKGAWRM